MKWLTLFICIVVVAFLVTRVALPWIARLCTSFRLTVHEVSPLRVRGLEWRSKSQADSIVPSWRAELFNWSLGGPAAPGKLTIHVEGVTIRVHKKRPDVDGHDDPHPKKASLSLGMLTLQKKRPWPSWIQAVINHILHLLLHHWITAAGFLSVHITNVRVIFEDLDGLEVRFSDGRLAFGQDVSVPPAYEPPLQPDEHSTRRASTAGNSPGMSRARRHGPTPSISQMSKAVWSHAIGNAIGRMAFSLRVRDATVLLPRSSSVAAEKPSHAKGAHAAFASLNSVLRNRRGRSRIDPALRPSQSGYERIASLDTPSNILVSLGIGPATEVFDKDNLRADVRLGNLQLGVEGLEKVVAIDKARRKLRDPARQTTSRVWAEGSRARVSTYGRGRC